MGRAYAYQNDPAVEDACWGLRCPYCGSVLHEVVQTLAGIGCIVRRRKCFNGHRFIGQEKIGSNEAYQQADRRVKRKKGKLNERKRTQI